MNRDELDEYLDSARDENNSLYEAHDKMESYLSPVFNFTRRVRGHTVLGKLPVEMAVREVDGWIMRKGYATIEEGWRSELATNPAEDDCDSRALFVEGWDSVRFLPGETLVGAAWQRVKEGTLSERIRRWPGCASEKHASFIALAAELQEQRGDDPILLPCRTIGERMRVNKETISIYRRLAIKKGLLRVVTEHRLSRGEATEFRFDKARLEELLASDTEEMRPKIEHQQSPTDDELPF